MTAPQKFVVVGAGIIGASIAWHLVASGAEVTVIDAGGGGGIATPNSFAWINAHWRNPEPYLRLRMRSMAEWRRLAAEVPALPLSWTGSLDWDLSPAEIDDCVRQQSARGYEIRSVGRPEAAAIEPNLVDPPERALHAAGEGAVEPRRAAQVLLADAERRGAIFRRNAAAIRLVIRHGRTTGIQLSNGELAADRVVLAAGARTAELTATTGVSLPLTTPPGLLVHAHPHMKLLEGLVLTPNLHMRQTVDGRIVAGADFGGSDPGDAADDEAAALFARVKAMLRGGEALTLDRYSVGYRPTPADGFPVVGQPSGDPGLYLAVLHSGITLAPVVGSVAAEEMLTGRRDPLMDPYAAARFG
ncbi:NAD(P)/FAD-dependent oxidoreductase [Geminicoccus roseus]|uniref:NAD(P)/FAD-dependent oxidoreductase n=1 Tax=Geminicoccus roseus TaxID=404900 RepID=UPI0003F8C723|nr:FAD-binding oxidoreductase [Geminicoccus roseus]